MARDRARWRVDGRSHRVGADQAHRHSDEATAGRGSERSSFADRTRSVVRRGRRLSHSHRALDLLQSATFDAVIADLGMPTMDGLELIRSVRRTLPPPANRIPAAALTAYARSEDRVTALASGFQMHIAKPVNPAELVIAVAALLGR